MTERKTLFPEIGSVAHETAQQSEPQAGQAVGEEDDDRAVQEVESLCMKCYKQVRIILRSSLS